MPTPAERAYDQWLVLRCQDGEQAALRELVERWDGRLRAHAWRLTRHREAARDTTQEAWLAIARGLRQLDDPAYFRAWAYRIVTHKCADWTRSKQRERRLLDGARKDNKTVNPPAAPSDSIDEESDIQRALWRLPLEQRAILSMRYLGELSVIEIAAALDIPLGTVKSRLHKARNELRLLLEGRNHE